MARTKKTARSQSENYSGKRPPRATFGGKTPRNFSQSEGGSERGKGKGKTSGRRKIRYRPGTVALREIRRYQKSTELLIRKLPFQRLIREITEDFRKNYFRWTAAALCAIQASNWKRWNEVVELFQMDVLRRKYSNMILIFLLVARKQRKPIWSDCLKIPICVQSMQRE